MKKASFLFCVLFLIRVTTSCGSPVSTFLKISEPILENIIKMGAQQDFSKQEIETFIDDINDAIEYVNENRDYSFSSKDKDKIADWWVDIIIKQSENLGENSIIKQKDSMRKSIRRSLRDINTFADLSTMMDLIEFESAARDALNRMYPESD